jgi:hypothetical protein
MDTYLKRNVPSTSHDEQNQSKDRKYSESYLKYGLSVMDDNHNVL